VLACGLPYQLSFPPCLKPPVTPLVPFAADETSSPIGKPSAKKKQFKLKFRSEWLHQSQFKHWLFGPSSSYCTEIQDFSVCNKTVPCHRSGLVKHENSQSRVSLMKSREKVISEKNLV